MYLGSFCQQRPPFFQQNNDVKTTKSSQTIKMFFNIKLYAKRSPFMTSAFTRVRKPILALYFFLFAPTDFDRLRRISRDLALIRSHILYEHCLRRVDSNLSVPTLGRKDFLSKHGWGVGSLNSYRRVFLSAYKTEAFEKIYRNSSEDLYRLLWFHREILVKSPGTIKTPRIVKLVRGAKMSLVYFEFLAEARSINDDELLAAALQFRERTKALFLGRYDSVVFEFRREPTYRDGVTKLQSILEKTGNDPDLPLKIEKRLMQPDVPRRVTHGDISWGNVLRNGFILDFDKSGYFPAGYEFGWVLGKYHDNFESPQALESLARDRIAPECAWTLIGVLYFSAVFYSRRAGPKMSDGFIVLLLERTRFLIENERAQCKRQTRL